MSWVRSGSVRCKCVPYQDKHILGSGGDSQSVSTVFSGFLVASIPWRIVRQSLKVTDSFLSSLFNLIVFRIFISKARALNKLIRLDFELPKIDLWSFSFANLQHVANLCYFSLIRDFCEIKKQQDQRSQKLTLREPKSDKTRGIKVNPEHRNSKVNMYK